MSNSLVVLQTGDLPRRPPETNETVRGDHHSEAQRDGLSGQSGRF